MSPITHTDSLIKVSDQQLDIQFKMSKAVDFSFDLKYDLNGVVQHQPKKNLIAFRSSASSLHQLKASDYIKVKQHGFKISFMISLPTMKFGYYLFTIYATDESDNDNSGKNKSKNLPPVFTYLIKYE
jgi:hypothetical protein